jgi:hypothetical protein
MAKGSHQAYPGFEADIEILTLVEFICLAPFSFRTLVSFKLFSSSPISMRSALSRFYPKPALPLLASITAIQLCA